MRSDRFARAIAVSIARRQSRGLVDDAAGLADVVIHGRVDLLAVAEDLIAAAAVQADPARRSWAAWFAQDVEDRCEARRRDRRREQLSQRLADGPTEGEAAITRLRLRRHR